MVNRIIVRRAPPQQDCILSIGTSVVYSSARKIRPSDQPVIGAEDCERAGGDDAGPVEEVERAAEQQLFLAIIRRVESSRQNRDGGGRQRYDRRSRY